MSLRALLAIPCTIALCVVSACAASPEELPRQPPAAEYESPTAAAYEVVLKVLRGWGPPGEDRVTRTRDGVWLREDILTAGKRQTVFSNFATATSFTVTRDEAGDYNNLVVARSAPTDTYHRYTRVRTGDRDLVLGERCAVWAMARLGEKEGPRHLNCVTEDGITLWSRVYYHSGEIMRSEEAVSLKRLRRAQIEVRPPNELFNWSYWERRGGESRSPHQKGDFEVTSAGAFFATKQTQLIRRHGQWNLVDSKGANGSRELAILGGKLSLRYEAGAGSAPISLMVSVHKFKPSFAAPFRQDRPGESVVGETCAWFDVWPGIHDAGRHECRTQDGLPLQIVQFMRGRTSLNLIATSVKRQPLNPASVRPPQDIFEWGQ